MFKLFRPFLRPYRRSLGLGVLLAVAEVAVGLAQPWPLRFIVDHVLPEQGSALSSGLDRTALSLACLALVAIVSIGALLDYWSTRLLSASGLHIATELRSDVFEQLNRLSLRFHQTHRVGDLSTRVTADVDRSQDLLIQILAVLLPNALLMIGMIAVMFWIDPMLAVMALITTPLLVIAVQRSTSELRRASKRSRKADGQVAAATTEHLGAIHLVQAMSLEDEQQARFERLTGRSLVAGLDAVRLQARFSPIVDLTAVISTVTVLWVGAGRVESGRLTVGDLLVVLSYVGSLYKPIKALAKLSNVASKGAAAAERLDNILAEQPAVRDQPGVTLAPPLRGAIEFENVSFSYGRELVLDRVDLSIGAGESVALVGPTGAGKSTLVSLIPRLDDPGTGVVKLDGRDVRTMALRSLRRQVSMVLQDCLLLHGTLRDNIACGRPGASVFDVEAAAKLALVDEFASRLPDGLDTRIGERGTGLSGGQRQRIAIARAILRDTPILILDEPTSALDPDSELLIVQALSNLPAGRTTLVIAHRLSTIRHADRIVVLERGRIVESGAPDDLLAVDGQFRQMAVSSGLAAAGLAVSGMAAAAGTMSTTGGTR
ncbi:MAG: ABC transporter ATP-binding protein [Acidimicrobiia bacterium]